MEKSSPAPVGLAAMIVGILGAFIFGPISFAVAAIGFFIHIGQVIFYLSTKKRD